MTVIVRKQSLPEGTSPEILATTARGEVEAFQPIETVITPNGPRQRREPMPCGGPVKVTEPLAAFERSMVSRMRERDRGPIFSRTHHVAAGTFVEVGTLVRRGLLKCSSLDDAPGSGEAGGMDAIIHTLQRWRRMEAKLASINCLRPRNASAQAGRVTITARDVVSAVLLDQDSLRHVLARHGWAENHRHRGALVLGMKAGLDAIYGL